MQNNQEKGNGRAKLSFRANFMGVLLQEELTTTHDPHLRQKRSVWDRARED